MRIVIAVLALVVGLLGMALVSRTDTFGLRAALLLGQLALFAPFWLSRHALGPSPREAFAWFPPGPTGLVLSAGCGAALWIAGAGLLQLQHAVWPPPDEVLRFFRQLHGQLDLWPPWQGAFSMLAIAVGPAVTEEIAFRGALLGTLRARLGDRAAVWLSALLFAAIHLSPGAYRVPFTLGLGLALGALRVRAGSVVPGIVAHAVLNATTVVVTDRLGDAAASPETGSALVGAGALVFGGVLAAALAAPIRRGARA